jgi:copper chaperone
MKLQLKVPSMVCGSCAETITKAVRAVDPTAVVVANPKTKLVEVETQQPQERIARAIADASAVAYAQTGHILA